MHGVSAPPNLKSIGMPYNESCTHLLFRLFFSVKTNHKSFQQECTEVREGVYPILMPKFENIKDLPDPMAITAEEMAEEKEPAQDAPAKPDTNVSDDNAELTAKLLANPEMAAFLKSLAKNL